MSITLLQEGFNTGTTNVIVTMAAPVTSGSLLVVMGPQASASTSAALITGIVMNGGGSATWHFTAGFPSTADPPSDGLVGVATGIQIAWALRVVGGATTLTITEGSARNCAYWVYEFAGVDPDAVGPDDWASGGGSIGQLTLLGAPVDLSRAGVVISGVSLAIPTTINENAPASVPASGWAYESSAIGATGHGVTAYQIFNSDTAAASPAWTVSPTRQWGAAAISFLAEQPPEEVVHTPLAIPTGIRGPENTLGCGRYTAQVYTRGGDELVFDNLPVAGARWSRVLSDTSDASVALEGIGLNPECLDAIRSVRTRAHELALVRDGVVVWQGPILTRNVRLSSGGFGARDLSWWYDHRYLPLDRSYAQVDLATIFNELAVDALSEDDSPNITVEATPTDVLATRIYRAGNFLIAGNELRELTKAGVDWTFLVREALVGGLVVPADPIVLLQDDHLATAPDVTEDGTVGGTRQTYIGAGGGEQAFPIFGQALSPSDIATYGLSDEVFNVDAIRDETSAVASAASRLALMSVPPVVLTTVVLSQSAPVLMEQLIPGAVIGCAFKASAIEVAGSFRLQKVEVDVAGDGESVTLTLQPLGAGGDS